jgi:hypothetical protein
MSGTRTHVPKKSEGRPVSKPHDLHEHEAELAGDVVARGGSVAGWSFTKVPSTPLQRQEVAKEKNDDDKKKEALEKVAEAALETPQGKALKEKVLADPLVKTVKDAVTSTPGMIGTGLAAAGGVAALGAAKKPLPFQPPAIPLDKITPGLSAQVRLDGPVNAPTFVGLTLTYKEQGPKGKPTAKSDQIARDTAALKAQQEMFKPASQKLAEKQEADEFVQNYIRSQKLTIPLTPGAKPDDVPKKDDAQKKDEDKPVQRAAASSSAAAPTHANVDGALATSGRPIESSARSSLEQRFGHDFSKVRVHDDANAGATAESIDAAAFTVGEDVVFAPGRYDTTSAEGRRLLAHELAHVVQQRSDGRPLEARHRAFFEPRLDADLGNVRIHTDAAAAASAADVRARAFALGPHVVFGHGHYDPDTPRGRWLLGHELAHVAQGTNATGVDGTKAVERDASKAATEVVSGRRARVRARRSSNALHLFGEPDHVPDLTFISTHETTRGFLDDAVRFHRTWGLNPQRFNSMQGLVGLLAANTGAISRLRMVSHANFDNLFTPLFDGGAAGITEDDLLAYAQSDVAGLEQTLGPPIISDATLRSQILTAAQTAQPGVFQAFDVNPANPPTTGPVARLIDASIDLLAVRTADRGQGAIPADQRATLVAARTAELAGLRPQVQPQPRMPTATTPVRTAQDLQDAITGVTGFNFQIPPQDTRLITAVRAATAGIATSFRTNLEAARRRITASTWIDLRGCRVGQRTPYLNAVATFFGTGTTRPHVSGPDWFQSYPTLGTQPVADSRLRTFAADTDVQTALQHWSDVTGVHDRLMWWIRFLGDVLRRESQRLSEEAQEQSQSPLTPPSLRGGLHLDLGVDPFSLGLGDQTLRPLPQTTLPEPRFRRGGGPTTPRLRDPFLDQAMRDIPRYTAPEGELRYYLDADLPLLVQSARDVQRIYLYMKQGREQQAMNAWLESEWSPDAPGLAALERGGIAGARQVEALSDLDPPDAPPDQRRTVAMVVSPDPLYAGHIRNNG